MKIIKKSNVKTNAIEIPSEAAKALNIKIYLFIRKNMDTLKEHKVCVVKFTDEKGLRTQTEDIFIKDSFDLGEFGNYSALLKQTVQYIKEIDGKKEQLETNCIKDLKDFLRNKLSNIPIRLYYNNGYGWTKDATTDSIIRFYGSYVTGIDDKKLDDNEHHLTQKGDMKETIIMSNEVMKNRRNTQFMLAVALAAPICGALSLKSLIVNIHGVSSIGKSTLLRLITSFWSNPKDVNLATTWNSTENALVAYLNRNEGIPLMIDDTSQGKIKNFTDIIYNMENGSSKGRLNREFEVGNICHWNTCIISSSENSMFLATDSSKKGILRRIVELDVVQGDIVKDQIQASKIDKISNENYGDVGMNFINKLFENGLTDNNFKKLSELLNNEKEELQKDIDVEKDYDCVSMGLAEKLAVVLLASKLGKEYLGLEFDIEDMVEYIQTLIASTETKLRKVIIEKQDFDSAYQAVCDYAEQNFDVRFKKWDSYNIPVKYFNIIENKLGYKFKELRILFMEKGVCNFPQANGEKELENSVRIAITEGAKTDPVKVIAVTKPLGATIHQGGHVA